jgi:hypothetical protein
LLKLSHSRLLRIKWQPQQAKSYVLKQKADPQQAPGWVHCSPVCWKKSTGFGLQVACMYIGWSTGGPVFTVVGLQLVGMNKVTSTYLPICTEFGPLQLLCKYRGLIGGLPQCLQFATTQRNRLSLHREICLQLATTQRNWPSDRHYAEK